MPVTDGKTSLSRHRRRRFPTSCRYRAGQVHLRGGVVAVVPRATAFAPPSADAPRQLRADLAACWADARAAVERRHLTKLAARPCGLATELARQLGQPRIGQRPCQPGPHQPLERQRLDRDTLVRVDQPAGELVREVAAVRGQPAVLAAKSAGASSAKSPNVPVPCGRRPCDHFLKVCRTYPRWGSPPQSSVSSCRSWLIGPELRPRTILWAG